MADRKLILDNPQATFVNTEFDPNSFFGRKREVVFQNTLLYQLKVLKDTGRYDAFKLKWHPSYSDEPDVPPIPNHLFWDSDVAKWIEGACYFLQSRQHAEIEAAVHELVAMIQSAQQPDGYLNIHFTVVEPTKRFTNLRDLHELYNAGHLIEAALAHEQLFHTGALLRPLERYVDLLHAVLGPAPPQLRGYPGHPEIELALLRLHKATGSPKALALARFFLDERGRPDGVDGRHFYDGESEARGERFNERPHYYPQRRSYWYQQAHAPIVEQVAVEGHAVRAMYLLTAAADLVGVEGVGERAGMAEAVGRLWRNMVERKMYLTGGIGAVKQWEGFGIDWFLPQGTDEGGCYAETCASIGVMMLAERMLQIKADGEVADVMELNFYNAVLTAGVQRDGPVEAIRMVYVCLLPTECGEVAGKVSVNVHMYGSATLTVPVGDSAVTVKQESEWPYDGKIGFEVKAPEGIEVDVKLRIPSWASEWQVSPDLPADLVSDGYLLLSAEWISTHRSFELNIPLKPRIIRPHPYTNQDIVALARGPIVYCVEDVDNPWDDDHFKSLIFDPASKITETLETDPTTNEKYVSLTAHDGVSFLKTPDHLAMPEASSTAEAGQPGKTLKFVPYYFRANRGGKGHMRVGLRRKSS
ncbi:Six-hairpin glycosidase-like protein [Neofusicoccum parvum]|nr:Six-hairpin glycosidase-like protein [Neofusicoccum parvum]